MNISQWTATPGAPDITTLLADQGITGSDPKAVDQLMLNLIRHACDVETAVNAGLAANRTNYFSNSISESGEFRGSVRLPVQVSNITVAP
jgi:hypothetical protein